MGKPVIDTHRGDSVFRRDRAGKVLAYRGGAAGDAAGANSSNARTSGRGRGSSRIKQRRSRKRKNVTTSKLVCPQCSRPSFSSLQALRGHMMVIHEGQRLYQCEVCARKFSQKIAKNNHLLCHMGVRNFSCSYCPRRFRTKHGANIHMMLHTNKKPFECAICNHSFTRLQALSKHNLTHFPSEKPYNCSECGTRFQHLYNLRLHLRIHTGERPYLCPYSSCGFQSFRDPSNFRKHMASHAAQGMEF